MVDLDQDGLAAIVRNAVRAEALPRFGKLKPAQISEKSAPDDLVTEADLAVEERISKAIARSMPDALMVGEEAVAEDPSLLDQIADAELSVILDPIDGTWNFAHMLPVWGSILAICLRGEPVFGLIYDPMTDHMLGATKGEGLCAWRGKDRTELTPHATNELTGFMPITMMPNAVQTALASMGARLGRVTSMRASAHEHRSVARGLADWQITGALMPWDHAAGALMAREAGGVARLLDGREYNAGIRDGHMLTARTSEIWDHVAGALSPYLL